jgi:hypothetical protein
MSRDDYTDKVFASRAVSPQVAAARGYRRYDANDLATVLGVDARLNERPGWLRKVLRAPGWAIPKCAVMPGHEYFGWTPYAQLRPDWPVMEQWYGHDHGGMLHRGEDDPKLQNRKGRNRGRCYCGIVHKRPPVVRGVRPGSIAPEPGESFPDFFARGREVTREWWEPQIRDRREHESSVCDWARVPDEMKARVGLRVDGELVEDGNGKVLVPTGHLHPDTGEVVLPFDRPHAHLDWAKYVYVKGRGKAQRLGTHPWVRAREFAAPEGLFVFVIEGTLKLDAVVSAGWPGIEAGSVTLWDAVVHDEVNAGNEDPADPRARFARELEDFARLHLEGVPTAVVCDSDWAENWMVRAQVDAAVSILSDCGVPAVGCAPPPGRELGWADPLTGEPKRAKHGIDDWLYLDGERPEDGRHDALLDIVVREDGVDAPGLEAAVAQAWKRSDARENCRTVVRELGRRATDSGVVAYKEDAIARSLQMETKTLQRHRAKLAQTGALAEIAPVEYVRGGGGVRAVPPRLLLRPDLVPPPRRRTLREWLGSR